VAPTNKPPERGSEMIKEGYCSKGCNQPERDCVCEMATVEAVLNATQETAPEGWTVSHEYPDCVGVSHPTFTNDEFIMFGDVNGFFAFNDCLNVCGDMEELTDAQEIAKSFWQQIAKIYPNLVKGE
jgi:hypothetical protein